MSGSQSSATDHHSGDVTDDVTLAQLTVIYHNNQCKPLIPPLPTVTDDVEIYIQYVKSIRFEYDL